MSKYCTCCLLFCLLLINSFLYGQKNENVKYPVDLIPQQLLKNANSIVRSHEQNVQVVSEDQLQIEVKTVLTILNQEGERSHQLFIHYSPSIDIENLKGSYYNSEGALIKKIKKTEVNDFADISYYSVYEDSRVQYIKPAIGVYPYTVELEYDLKFNGYFDLRDWFPQPDYNQSVQLASLNVSVPKEIGFRFKPYNIAEIHFVEEEGIERLSSKVQNLPAIAESVVDPFYKIVPSILLSTYKFKMGNYEGDLTTWNSYGNFFFNLNKDREDMPSDRFVYYNALVVNANSDYEKVSILYKYLQENFRYVSVQEGIGGYQTFTAKQVDANKYGDCKGLTYCLKGMLKSAGIESYPVLIRAGENEPDVPADFPNSTFNHVVLMVPLKQDTVWIESTSPDLPFNYLGSFTENRYGLLINESGSMLIRTPKYGKETNKLIRNSQIKISGDSIRCNVYCKAKGNELEKLMHYQYLTGDGKTRKFIKGLKVTSVIIPYFSFDYSYQISEANIDAKINYKPHTITGGNRVFITPFLFNDHTDSYEKYVKNKTISAGKEVVWIDTVFINYPEGFKIESARSPVVIESIFANVSMAVDTMEEGQVEIVRKITWKEFDLTSELFPEYLSFIKMIREIDNSKIVFVKE